MENIGASTTVILNEAHGKSDLAMYRNGTDVDLPSMNCELFVGLELMASCALATYQ